MVYSELLWVNWKVCVCVFVMRRCVARGVIYYSPALRATHVLLPDVVTAIQIQSLAGIMVCSGI